MLPIWRDWLSHRYTVEIIFCILLYLYQVTNILLLKIIDVAWWMVSLSSGKMKSYLVGSCDTHQLIMYESAYGYVCAGWRYCSSCEESMLQICANGCSCLNMLLQLLRLFNSWFVIWSPWILKICFRFHKRIKGRRYYKVQMLALFINYVLGFGLKDSDVRINC